MIEIFPLSIINLIISILKKLLFEEWGFFLKFSVPAFDLGKF
jgi:hypothetical protein